MQKLSISRAIRFACLLFLSALPWGCAQVVDHPCAEVDQLLGNCPNGFVIDAIILPNGDDGNVPTNNPPTHFTSQIGSDGKCLVNGKEWIVQAGSRFGVMDANGQITIYRCAP